jgi:hypothetical protein
MSIIKPVVIVPQLLKNLCPICGKASYSRGGIHPQCAMQQADEPRTLRLRAARIAESKIKVQQPKKKSRQKKCPKCDIQVDVQREVCHCGFQFRGR